MERDDFMVSDSQRANRAREASLRKQPIRQSWPLLIMIPVLTGILHACAFALMIEMFLGETFGLSAGRPAPWPGAIALIFLASFWANRAIAGAIAGATASQAMTFVCWLGVYFAWIVLEPTYRDTDVWSRPGQFVQSEAYLIMPLLISMIVWWVGMNYATDIANISAEEVRSVVLRDWFILFGSILLAAMAGGAAGANAFSVARIAAPLLLIVSLALVAGAEVESTRRMAMRRGGHPPGWGRWARLVGGLSVSVALLTLIVLAILSPDALGAIVGGIAAISRALGVVLGYILLAIVWTVFQVVILVSKLLGLVFGDMFGEIATPEMAMQPGINLESLRQQEGEVEEWEYAVLLRWVALFFAVAIVAVILFRVTRKPQLEAGDDGVDEHRDSVFSTDLARQQLRDLFRRKQRARKPLKLDLDRPPRSIRETMLYLETLALRQGVGRREAETAEDFAARLRAVWSGVSAPLIDLPRRYERVRYGELDDAADSPDFAPAANDWARVWAARKDVEPPVEDA